LQITDLGKLKKLPGLFVEVIGRMDERGHVIVEGLERFRVKGFASRGLVGLS